MHLGCDFGTIQVLNL